MKSKQIMINGGIRVGPSKIFKNSTSARFQICSSQTFQKCFYKSGYDVLKKLLVYYIKMYPFRFLDW